VNSIELRPAYRTLNEPNRLFGLSLSTILAAAAAGGLGYAWLLVSPLPWRANVSIAVIGLGSPLVLLAVIRWRTRPSTVEAVSAQSRVRRGAVRLDEPSLATRPPSPQTELPWLSDTEAEAGS
jgi:hypothetical protein